MGKYIKDKYSFSFNPSLVIIGENAILERANQIQELADELCEFKILFKDLLGVNIDYNTKNEILNLAKYINEDDECYYEFISKKELPYNLLYMNTKVQKKFLQQWNDYIVVYTLIFQESKYKYISDYLRIIENNKFQYDKTNDKNPIMSIIKEIEDIEEASKDEGPESEENRIHSINEESQNIKIDEKKGIVLAKLGKKGALIMTSIGEFLKVHITDDIYIGEEITGEKKKVLREYRLFIAIFSLLVAISLLAGAYKYMHVVSIVVIESDISVRLEVNEYGKVVNVISYSTAGEELIENCDLEDRNIDLSAYRVIEAMYDDGYISSDDEMIITVSGEALTYGTLEQTGEFIEENSIEVKVNNAGYEHKLY